MKMTAVVLAGAALGLFTAKMVNGELFPVLFGTVSLAQIAGAIVLLAVLRLVLWAAEPADVHMGRHQ